MEEQEVKYVSISEREYLELQRRPQWVKSEEILHSWYSSGAHKLTLICKTEKGLCVSPITKIDGVFYATENCQKLVAILCETP